MARPKPGNYAIYTEAGKKRYEAALRKYLANKKKAEEARKITSTKKNISKQKTANKKAATTTKTTKGTTSAKPTSTAAKGKSLATGKATSKTKAVEIPQTKTATKTRTRTRTQTKSKSTTTPKKKVESKQPVKQPAKQPAKKTAGKQVAKRQPFEPEKRGRGRPKGSKNIPKRKPFDPVDSGKKKPFDSVNSTKTNKNLKIGKLAKQGKELAGKAVDKTQEGVKNLKNKANKFFEPAKPNAPATTGPQKFFSKVGKKLGKGLSTAKNYTKTQVLPKLGRDALKILKNNPASTLKSAGTAGLGVVGQLTTDQLADRAFRAIRGENKKSLKQFREERDKEMGKRGLMRFRPKNIGKTINSLRGKGDNTSTQSSTTKNIKKQKKTNNNLSIRNIRRNKNKKNFYNTPDGKSPKAKEIATLQKNIRNAKGANKELLQNKLNYLQKFGKMSSFTVDKNSKAEREARKTNKSVSAPIKSAKPGSARAKMRAKNEARFGKSHVDKLRVKNKDFQAMKKKKLTKAEFIRRYPNSQTAKRARGM